MTEGGGWVSGSPCTGLTFALLLHVERAKSQLGTEPLTEKIAPQDFSFPCNLLFILCFFLNHWKYGRQIKEDVHYSFGMANWVKLKFSD